MLNIIDLRGTTLKKLLGFDRAMKRYHNKNKSGGNFGFTLIKSKNEKRKKDYWFNLHGIYDTEGNIRSLGFSTFDFRKRHDFNEIPESMEDLALKMKEPMKKFEEYIESRGW